MTRSRVPRAAPAEGIQGPLATHEAAHAVIDMLLLKRVDHVSIDGKFGRSVLSIDLETKPQLADAWCNGDRVAFAIIEPYIMGAVAGIIGEALVTNRPRWRLAASDFATAEQLLALSDAAASGARMDALVMCTFELLEANWSAVDAVARALIAKTVLTGDEVEALVGAATAAP